MKKYSILPLMLSIILLLISIITVGEKNTETTSVNTETFNQVSDEMKGIWVSYITLDMQNTDMSEESFVNKIDSIIKTTKESGFNTLIFQVRPFSDALYKSTYYPWSHILTAEQGKDPDFDPLEIICEKCHSQNIAVHAWINPYRVKTPDTPNHLSEDNPYIKDKSIGFEHEGSIYLDPSNEKAQELITNGVEEILKNYDVDGIQFDDYFYPQNCDNADINQYNKYKESTENPLPKEEWRKENVNKLIKSVYNTVHKYSRKAVFGISPQGNIKNNELLYADVVTWCEKEGYIDYIAPQIYFSLDNPSLSFEESLNDWMNLKFHKNLSIYIGLAGYKAGTDTDEGTWLDNDDILQNEIEISKEQGADGIILYSYESFSSEENSAEIQNVVSYLTAKQ